MYIEFSLPVDAAAQALLIIRKWLVDWAVKYGVRYTEKTIKHTHRVAFDDDAHYSLFAMTWNPDKKHYCLSRWRIVSDLNNKTAFDSVV